MKRIFCFLLILSVGYIQSFSQLKYRQAFAIKINGQYMEYKEREYGINLTWNKYPVYQWELRKRNGNGVVNNNTTVGLYNTFKKDFVVYASREYGINLKWLNETNQNTYENWIVAGLNSIDVTTDAITLKNTNSSVQSNPYLTYGEREYGINLVWGRRPSSDNITILLTGSQVVRYQSVPNANQSQQKLIDKASLQNGIIGSDYRGRKFIGMAPAERNENVLSQNKNMWYPIDGYKNTFCGTLQEYSVYDGWGGPISDNDDDMNLNLIPIDNSAFQTMLKNMWPIAGRKLADALPGGGNASIRDEIIAATSFDHVQAEIDVNDEAFKNHIYPGKNSAPKKSDYICAYGPYVMDKGHKFKPEIHPAEQLWWKHGDSYYLSAFCDVSDRFDERSKYDTDNGRLSFDRPWSEEPLRESFAIFFETEPRKMNLEFDISKVAGSNYFPTAIQPKNLHYLVIGRDTVVTVHERDGLDLYVRFENVTRNQTTSKIQGFIVIEMDLGIALVLNSTDTDAGGGLLLRVDKKVNLTSRLRPNHLIATQ